MKCYALEKQQLFIDNGDDIKLIMMMMMTTTMMMMVMVVVVVVVVVEVVVPIGSLIYSDYGLRLRINMLLRMNKTTWLFIFPA